jgi:hypothetical protein
MHAGIQHLGQLVYSFPIYDRLVRYKTSALEKPDVFSHLRDMIDARQATILAVDLASQEVVVGCMGQESPASRAVIGGRLVTVPR